MKAPVLATCLLALLPAVASAQPSPARTLNLTFHDDGTVTLAARQVTAREILAEWARQCGCYVVNADRLAGAPMNVPIAFERAPQAVVLRALLRQAAGYTLTPRRTGVTSPSDYETIYILPVGTSTPALASAPAPRPIFQAPTPGSPDDEIPPVNPIGPITQQDATQTTGAAQAGTPAAGPASQPASGLPAVNLPGVRVVPIAPVSPGAQPGSTPPAAPGGVTPARQP
jgi:hypothetical protein